MLNQITYDETSPLYGYLKQNGLVQGEEAYVAANSLTEEIDQGNPGKEPEEEITTYDQYFKNQRMKWCMDLMFGRKLAYYYMTRDGPSTQKYLKEQIIISGIWLVIGIVFICLPIGLKLGLAILLGLVYMFFKSISGSRIVDTLAKVGNPTVKLIHSFNKAYKHIKELQFIERGLQAAFDDNIKTSQTIATSIQTLDSYQKICVQERQSVGLEIQRIISCLLQAVSRIAKKNTKYAIKSEFLKNHYKDACNTGTIPTLEMIRKLLDFYSLARKELKQIVTGILFDSKVSNLDAHQTVHQIEAINREETEAARAIDLVIFSKQLKNRKEFQTLKQKTHLTSQQANICLCIQRLSYMKQSLFRYLASHDHPLKKNILELVFTELTGIQRLIVPMMQDQHSLADSDGPAGQTIEFQGNHSHPEIANAQQQDYELIMTEDGKQKVVKNRELNKVARDLEMLLFRKQKQKEMKYKLQQEQSDQRIRFNFIAQIKHETDGVILE